MIFATDTAIEKIKQQILKRGKGLGIRVGVKTTGCSGLAYVLEFVDTIEPEDFILSYDSVKICIGPKSQPYLNGLVIDYVRNGLNEGFSFKNPNEKDRCGCGESFRI